VQDKHRTTIPCNFGAARSLKPRRSAPFALNRFRHAREFSRPCASRSAAGPLFDSATDLRWATTPCGPPDDWPTIGAPLFRSRHPPARRRRGETPGPSGLPPLFREKFFPPRRPRRGPIPITRGWHRGPCAFKEPARGGAGNAQVSENSRRGERVEATGSSPARAWVSGRPFRWPKELSFVFVLHSDNFPASPALCGRRASSRRLRLCRPLE